jgi:hypothetical protein
MSRKGAFVRRLLRMRAPSPFYKENCDALKCLPFELEALQYPIWDQRQPLSQRSSNNATCSLFATLCDQAFPFAVKGKF